MNEKTYNRLQKFLGKKKDSQKLKKAERFTPSVMQGLSCEQVESRKEEHLTNQRIGKESKSYFKIVADNLFNFCNMVCIVLVILLCGIGAWDYTLSTSIVLVNIIIGIIQEVKAKKAVSKLTIVHSESVRVVRDGIQKEIPSSDIVLDDIFVIGAGAQVPVDAIVEEGYIEVDESILTGESVAIRKNASDKLLAGSNIVAGEAVCRADRVGKDCYIEGIVRIAKKINKPKSMIFNTLNFIIKVLSCVLIVLAGFIFMAERLSMGDTNGWRGLIINVASSVLGMLPIGMFMLTSTALAASVLKLAKTNALPKDIYSIEMLAQVDTLLLDKTGTITSGQMKVVDMYQVGQDDLDIGDVVASLNHWTKDKKPTAKALVEYFKDNKILECSDVQSFSSIRKCSSVTIGEHSYFLGAPDYLAVLDSDMESYCKNNSQLGKRTILLAKCKGCIENFDKEQSTPLAFFGLEDTLRDNVKETLDWFSSNDVDIKIISGDNPVTVSYIANKAGVIGAEKYINCSQVDDQTILDNVEDTVIFGRVSPNQKCKIVEKLKENGKVVGMIGDGVNDIQALKESDCSISFAQANEVARNISRIVLLANDFSSMPRIVREGRRVINNIEKVSSLYLMKTFMIMFMTLVFSIITLATGTPSYPFDTKKLLLIEFFVIGAPTFIYAFQPNNARISGKFMRNIIKSSVASSLGLIVAVFVMYGINFSLDLQGIENIANYKNSLLTLALTMSGFGALIIVSLPFNKLRASVIISMLVLAIVATYIDTLCFDKLFLGMEMIQFKHYGYIFVSALCGIIVNMFMLWLLGVLDKKYGEKWSENSRKFLKKLQMKRKIDDTRES